MEGCETMQVRAVEITVEHDAENDVMLLMTGPRKSVVAYLQPREVDALIAMLQRMQARQRGQG